MITAQQLLDLFEEQKEMLYHSTNFHGLEGILGSNTLRKSNAMPQQDRDPTLPKADVVPAVSFSRSRSRWHLGTPLPPELDPEQKEKVANPFRLIFDKGSIEKEHKLEPFGYLEKGGSAKEQETRSLTGIPNVKKHLRGVEFNTRGWDSPEDTEKKAHIADTIQSKLDIPVYQTKSPQMDKQKYLWHKSLENPQESYAESLLKKL